MAEGYTKNMLFIPMETPVLENLNSYYLNVERLIEHCQGALGSGGIHLKSATAEGIIFFDENDIVNFILRDKDGTTAGGNTLSRLNEVLENHAFAVAVYKIDSDNLYFWANLQNVEDYYTNLSSEFADLDGLIKKMQSERITGYIDVSISGGKEGGTIFFNNGKIIGASGSWKKEASDSTKENLKLLIQRSKDRTGVFNVHRASFKKLKNGTIPENREVNALSDFLTMIEELLAAFEKAFRNNKKTALEFDTILRRKFVEKAEEFDFLDPFAAEFQYANGRVEYSGKADFQEVAKGVIESVSELSEELGMRHLLTGHLSRWTKKYSREIKQFDLEM